MIEVIKNFLKLLDNKQKLNMFFLSVLLLIGTLLEVLSLASIYPLLLYFTDQDIIFFEVLNKFKNFSDNLLILLTILIFLCFYSNF